MKDKWKTKEPLLDELKTLRNCLAEMERMKKKHKRLEQALRESEERYRELVKHAPTGIYEIDIETARITHANDVICEYTGYSREELLYMAAVDILTDDSKERFVERQKTLLAGERVSENVEYKIKSKDGKEIWAIFSVRVLYEKGKATRATVVAHDISERKRIEEALESSEERLRILFEYAPDGYYLNDLEGNFVDGNKAAEEITGYRKEELIGKNFLNLSLLPLDQFPKAAACLAQNALGRPTGPDAFVLNRRDGDQVAVEVRTFPVKIQGQTLALGIARDISDRTRAEEALRESKERYEMTTKAGQVGVWDWNLETNEIYLDPNLKAMLGYEDYEIRNHLDDWGRLVHPDDAERVMAEADAHLQGSKPHYEIAHRMLHRDGSIRWFLARGNAVRDAKGKPYRVVGTDTDITASKRAGDEREMLQKQLEKALTKVLGGFINICANCKRIHDDSGHWVPIEKYIGEHTEAEFSHGICPECLRALYPDYEKS
jgi:PAS domain S-box-containing protein